MERCRLGKTKYELSKIGLGSVQFGLDYGFTKKKTQEQVDEILSYANERGINFIDTARSYGDSEEKIGNFISQNKNDFVIATKLGIITNEKAENKEILRKSILDSLEESLSKLKINGLDILQLHQTDHYLINNEDFWSILVSLKSEKIIESIGVSVYEEKETINLINNYGAYIDFLQVPYNVFDRRFESLQDLFSTNQIGVISRSVFLKGVITCKTVDLPDELKELTEYKIKLDKAAKKLVVGVPELALLYVYNKDFITSTILGIDTVQELAENINTVENKKTVNELASLDDLIVREEKLIDPRKWKNL